MLILYVLAAFAIGGGLANVQELTPDLLQKASKSKDLWIVEFYSPSCPYCQQFEPEYDKVGAQLRGSNIHVGRINGVRYDEVSNFYGVHGFPTVKIFKPGFGIPDDYGGPRTAQSLLNVAHETAQNKRVRSFEGLHLHLPMTPRVARCVSQ